MKGAHLQCRQIFAQRVAQGVLACEFWRRVLALTLVFCGGRHGFSARRRGRPTPLGFSPHPEGIFDNSPTFQRWVGEFRGAQVPKGRLEPREPSAVPAGLIVVPGPVPNVETLGYYRVSIRDKASQLFAGNNWERHPYEFY
jgi:hypothetical protein